MESRKIETSDRELGILIGLAADKVCEEKGVLGLDFMENAAKMAKTIIDHLTGERKFHDEDIELMMNMGFSK